VLPEPHPLVHVGAANVASSWTSGAFAGFLALAVAGTAPATAATIATSIVNVRLESTIVLPSLASE
jgi:hypothetical protein